MNTPRTSTPSCAETVPDIKARHTPGPWEAESVLSFGEFAIIGDGEEIAIVYATNGLDEPTEFPSNANASLIAAAPDMLAALQAVNKLISEAALTGFNCHDGDWAERLFLSQQATSSAIRKATK